jgi:hypothetical protein
MLGGVRSPEKPGRTAVESEETGIDLRSLHRHGWSISAITRRFMINRRTVAGRWPPRWPTLVG